MTIVQFLILVVIAAICGAIGQALAGYSLGGWIVSAIVGFIGAYLGVWIANQFGLPEIFVLQVAGESFPIVWSIIGSALLAALASLLIGRRRYSY
jgi:uncharacterized membrane protein YeaQ/YmgE (transglycosylase-associated protein family)